MNCACQSFIGRAIKHLWSAFTERADKEGWPAARLLAALAEHEIAEHEIAEREIAEHEIAERGQRRIKRHLAEARLPPGKTLSGFNVPVLISGPFQPFPQPGSWRLSPETAGWRPVPT